MSRQSSNNIVLTARDIEELDKLSQATKDKDTQVKKWGYTAILNDVLQRTDQTIEIQREGQLRMSWVLKGLGYFFFLLFIVLAVDFALTLNAMEMSKESHIKKGALTDKGGQVVKVSSTDFTLGSSGEMVQRTSASGQRRLAEEDSTPVGTAPVLSKYKLSSRILNKYLQELEQFSVVGGDQNMMQVSEELTSTENKVAFSRQAYNDAVMTYNTSCETFPGLVFATRLGFEKASLFEVEEAVERETPKVSFT